MIDDQRLQEILSEGVKLRLVEPHVYSPYAERENMNAYDRVGSIYDTIACNPLYNRLVWGYRTSAYRDLCQEALSSCENGWVLDAGCGSLAFTAETYAAYRDRPVVCMDQSLGMLKMAKMRLIKLNGEVPENMVFLHGDVLRLPFEPEVFPTVICLNVLHCLPDISHALLQMKNVSMPGGTMSLTTLVRNNRVADRYLDMLGKSGALVPRSPEEVVAHFEEVGIHVSCRVTGNLAFLSVHMPGGMDIAGN